MAATSIAIPPKRKMILKTLSSSRDSTLSSKPSGWTEGEPFGFGFNGRSQENAAFAPVMGSQAELSRLGHERKCAEGMFETQTAAGAVGAGRGSPMSHDGADQCSRKARAICSCMGLKKYSNGVRWFTSTKTSACMPAMR